MYSEFRVNWEEFDEEAIYFDEGFFNLTVDILWDRDDGPMRIYAECLDTEQMYVYDENGVDITDNFNDAEIDSIDNVVNEAIALKYGAVYDRYNIFSLADTIQL